MSDQPIKILRNPGGLEKMSEVLGDFAQPWLDAAGNDKEYKSMIALAIIAWNLSFLSETERFADLDPEVLEALGQPGRELLQSMITRKLAHYSGYDRPILDYEFSGDGDRLRLDVISGVRNPEKFLERAETG